MGANSSILGQTQRLQTTAPRPTHIIAHSNWSKVPPGPHTLVLTAIVPTYPQQAHTHYCAQQLFQRTPRPTHISATRNCSKAHTQRLQTTAPRPTHIIANSNCSNVTAPRPTHISANSNCSKAHTQRFQTTAPRPTHIIAHSNCSNVPPGPHTWLRTAIVPTYPQAHTQ